MKREPFERGPGGAGMGSYILLDRSTLFEVDNLTWAYWIEAERKKPFGQGLWKVGQTAIPGWGSVSTVFLGLDHGWGNEDKPVVFETMAFWRPRRVPWPFGSQKRRSMREEAGQWRYATWREAEAGHQLAAQFFRRHGKELMRLYMAGDKKALEHLLQRAQESVGG